MRILRCSELRCAYPIEQHALWAFHLNDRKVLHIQERVTLVLRVLEAYLAYELYAQTSRQTGGGACVLRLTLAGMHT